LLLISILIREAIKESFRCTLSVKTAGFSESKKRKPMNEPLSSNGTVSEEREPSFSSQAEC